MEELGSSELGSQVYWDKTYEEEISNFNNHGDIGEIWFGEDSLLRIVRWISKKNDIQKSESIIDIGCGNGMTLFELAREGFTNLTGIDYSKPAITLAAAISKEEFPHINYQVLDITSDDMAEHKNKYRIVHDKGTYDAICLNADISSKRSVYIAKVAEMLTDNGFFIITSCNWTAKELIEHFKESFELLQEIPTPQFKFGGSVGNLVTSLIFINKK